MLKGRSLDSWFLIYLLLFHEGIPIQMPEFLHYRDHESQPQPSNSPYIKNFEPTVPHTETESCERFKFNRSTVNQLPGNAYKMEDSRYEARLLPLKRINQFQMSDIFCIHDCQELNKYLESKTGALWILPKFANAFFRAIAQICFANNPWSGLLILIGLFMGGINVGILTSLSVAVAIVTAWCLRQDPSKIENGLVTYSAVLVGSVAGALWTSLYNEPVKPKVYGIVIVGAVMSVFLTSALGNILSRLNLPTLTLPFNVISILLYTDFMPPPLNSSVSARTRMDYLYEKESDVGSSRFSGKYVDLDFVKVLKGVIYSVGQVYAAETFGGSILMLIGLLINSPIVCFMSLVGGAVGTFTGLLFNTQPPYTNIYNGVWGYNGVLSAISVGGFYFRLNSLSFLVAVMNVVGAVLIQEALSIAFLNLRLPVFTFPFVLSTLLFVSVSATGELLDRVTQFSYPEKHIEDFVEQKRLNQTRT